MKIFNFNKGLYGLVLSLATFLVFLEQASFARDIMGVQKKSPFEIIQNNGKFGVARVSIENIRNKAFKNLFANTELFEFSTLLTYYYCNLTSFPTISDLYAWLCDKVFLSATSVQ